MGSVHQVVGGRKITAGLVSAVLLTGMALVMEDASYTQYATSLVGVLGLVVGSVAYEDARR